MAAEPLIGSLIAERYRVLRRLGAGGMGTVYVALQEPLGREVALKVVRRDLASDDVALERFRREAEALAKVQHPHIVTLFDFGDLPSGALYFAMELVRGQTLRQRLRSRGPLTAQRSVELVKQCCAALSCAHALGIIHRDLKPENILLMEAAGTPDFVKVVDFGVAKVVRGNDDATGDPEKQLTERNSLVGTPGYIAPEVALKGITTDPRSDLYALGVLWFECLTGDSPFRAPTPTALIMAHALDPPPPLPETVPLPIAGLVSRLLAKTPDDRPSSAEDLLRLLEQLPSAAGPAHVPFVEPTDPNAATAGHTPRPRARKATPAPTPPTEHAPIEATPGAEENTESATQGASARRNWLAIAAGAAAAALLGGGLAVASLRPSGAADAGFIDPDEGADASVPAWALMDAGAVQDDANADAGDVVIDAGRTSDAPDAGPKPKKRPKRPRDAGYAPPDIYDLTD
jgi:eukaryotic-like serine/threonine-protein kinase